MKLSIITFNNNNRSGLSKTIDSVIVQSRKDFEWIVIDGGSTDGSRDLIEQHSDCFSFWCSETDCGIYNAMNKGIEHASGDWLLFLNSGSIIQDDIVLKEIFSHEYFEDILWGNIASIDGNYQYCYPQRDDFSMFYLIEHPIPLQSALIKRKLFEKYGVFDCDKEGAFDFAFFLKTIVANQCPVRFLPQLSVIANPFDTLEKHKDRNSRILICMVQQYPRLIGEDNPQLQLPSEVDSAMRFWRYLQNNWFAQLLYSTIIKPFNKILKKS